MSGFLENALPHAELVHETKHEQNLLRKLMGVLALASQKSRNRAWIKNAQVQVRKTVNESVCSFADYNVDMYTV